MERQRSFSFKSSKFLALSLILSFSVILITFSSFSVTRDIGYGSLHTAETHLLELEGISPRRSLELRNVAPDIDSGVIGFRNLSLNSSNLMSSILYTRQEISTSHADTASTEFQILENDKSEEASVDVNEVDAEGSNSSIIILMDRKVDEKRIESEENQSDEELDNGDGNGNNLRNGDLSVSLNPRIGEDNNMKFQVGRNGSESSTNDKEEAVPAAALEVNEPVSIDGGYNGNVTSSVGFPSIANLVDKESSIHNCDISKGKWVYEESYPLYTNFSCPFIDEGFNCKGNGRLDDEYTKWRWQPQDCELLRFNATRMLESIRGKRLVFVGDSINRNQWESMLCMLMAAIKDTKRVYETRGRRITKEKGNYSFRFVDYQCTVEFHVSHYLVHEGSGRIGQKRRSTLRIDRIDRGSSRWRGADVLIFNTANWWSHSKTRAGTNYYQEGKQVHRRMEVLTAFERALTTWGNWVDSHIDPLRTRVFFRNSAPAHFRGGEWNTGGHCREAKEPLSGSTIAAPSEKDLIVAKVVTKMKTPVTLLNVTTLSAYRIDGHPSIFGTKLRRGVEDCSHWCLPGVPDTWNQLLYHHLVSEKTNDLIHSS